MCNIFLSLALKDFRLTFTLFKLLSEQHLQILTDQMIIIDEINVQQLSLSQHIILNSKRNKWLYEKTVRFR